MVLGCWAMAQCICPNFVKQKSANDVILLFQLWLVNVSTCEVSLFIYIYIDASCLAFIYIYIDMLWRIYVYIYIFMRYILLGVLTWFAFGLKEVLKHKQFSRSDIALC